MADFPVRALERWLRKRHALGASALPARFRKRAGDRIVTGVALQRRYCRRFAPCGGGIQADSS